MFNGTRLAQFLLMFASAGAGHAGADSADAERAGLTLRGLVLRAGQHALLILGCILVAFATFALVMPETRALFAGGDITLGAPREVITARLLDRLTGPWTILFLTAMLAAAGTLALAPRLALTAPPAGGDNPDELSVRALPSALSPGQFAVDPSRLRRAGHAGH